MHTFIQQGLARTALATAAALASQGASAQISSTFEAGLQGWTGTGGTVTWVATGGNGGGFLQQVDTLSTFMTVSAPGAYFGNLSAYLGGSLSFDGRNLNNVASNLLPPGPWFGTVTITGSAGSAVARLAGSAAGQPPPDGLWHRYAAPLVAASWSGNLAAVLGNVSGITVQLEFNNDIVESAGFDNFAISAVPEVAGAPLWLAGLALLGWAVRRKG